jgi:hypothetical protein
MASYSRLMPQFAAIPGIAALPCNAAPAVAAEIAVVPTAKSEPSVFKRHVSRGAGIATSHHDPRVSPIHRDLDCSSGWCGRQFVLMNGVGY